jgi:signal transduction histidine kinase
MNREPGTDPGMAPLSNRRVAVMDLGLTATAPWRRHPAIADALVPALLAMLFLVVPVVVRLAVAGGLPVPEGRGPVDLALTGPDIALTLVSAIALTARRHRPLVVLVATAAVTAVAIAGGWQVNLAQLAVAVALFNYGLRRPRPATIVAGALAAATLGSLSALMVVVGEAGWGRQDVVLWLCTAAAVAIAVQSRRATIEALEDRARRAEESREETIRRRVAEDRVRLARELHDVIAHHVAVISVQAGVAEHVVDKNPLAARQALGIVRSSAKTVLAELQSVLGVLRQDETTLPTAPAPGLLRLDDLVASFGAMGTSVHVDAPQPLPQLPPAADVVAYRTVQEALTNVHKHAAGAATTISISPRVGVLEIEVRNERPPASLDPVGAPAAGGGDWTGSGLGLVGMEERVAAAGGVLQTGPTADGGFRVTASLPLPLLEEAP